MKVELHIHTNSSNDSLLSKHLLLIACKIKKINCIAITDHNTIKSAIKWKNYFLKHGISIIVGEEIFTTHGEIIGLFLSNTIEPFMSPEETIKEIKRQGGLVYIPHPYDKKRKKTILPEEKIDNLKSQIDIMECHNGRNIESNYSIKQTIICDKYNIQKVVGSDAHTVFELGRNIILMDEFNSQKDFCEKLKKAVLIKKKCLKSSHIITKVNKGIKYILKGDFRGLFRAVFR